MEKLGFSRQSQKGKLSPALILANIVKFVQTALNFLIFTQSK